MCTVDRDQLVYPDWFPNMVRTKIKTLMFKSRILVPPFQLSDDMVCSRFHYFFNSSLLKISIPLKH